MLSISNRIRNPSKFEEIRESFSPYEIPEAARESNSWDHEALSAVVNSPSKERHLVVDRSQMRYSLLLDFAKKCGISNAEIEGHIDTDEPQLQSLKEDQAKDEVFDEEMRKLRESRKMVFQELLDTERNYVKLLSHVLEQYRKKLEISQMISGTDLRQIFGNLPEICKMHAQLEKEMENVMDKWSQEALVGHVMAGFCEKFLVHYPPYLNYLEQALLRIKELSDTNSKFKIFLKQALSQATYSRQDLSDLLSLPVQRLPRYALLLGELRKKTEGVDPTHPDINHLDTAIQQIKKVTRQVNSAKGQTEMHISMFEIVNEIENCPPSVLSSQRHFELRFNCTIADNSKELNTKHGEKLTIILFNDIFLLCRRKRNFKSSKTSRMPKRTNSGKGHQEALSFKAQFSGSVIIKIIDIIEAQDCQRCISFMIQTKDRGVALMSFQVKTLELKSEVLCRTAEFVTNVKMADKHFADDLVVKVDHNQLNLSTKELMSSNLKRFATSAGRKLTRFSSRFNLRDISLTHDQRYDSEASLTSIDSVMSMIHLSMGSSYISPPKVEPNSPPVSGLRSVRGLFKKKTSRRSAFASVGETEFDLATPDA